MMSTIKRWARSWIFYHIVFWASMFLTYFADIIEYLKDDPVAFTVSILIRLVMLAGLMYGNMFILIPNLLNKKKNLLYWCSVLALVLVFASYYKAIYFKTTDVVFEIPQKGRYLLNVLLAIRFLFISYLFIFVKGWFDQEKKISQIKVDQLSTELKYLRAQVNPHFLFNTLNNLYGLALKKSDKAPEVILRLSDIMDYMLYESTEAKVPLRKDVENLINYIEIEKIRQGNNAKIDFRVTGEINTQKIIPLLILPLLENGFKHGVNKEASNAYLNGHLEITSTSVELSVINNKSAVADGKENGHGIGLTNLKKRLDLFYPQKHKLHIEEMPNSYKASLKIELI